MSRQFIIGISAYYHEASVALFESGKLVCYMREEWLSRIKGDRLYPRLSLAHIKTKFEIQDAEIEAVCFYEKPLKGWLKLLHHGLKHPIQNRKMLANHLRSFWDGPCFVTSQIQNTFKIERSQILFAPHHLSHTLSALHHAPSHTGWAALVVDGVGDGETAVIYDVASSINIQKVWSAEYPHSLGLFYSAITDYLGFFVNDGEYQVMALASYGSPIHADEFLEKVIRFDNGNIVLEHDYFAFESDPERSFSPQLEKLLGPCRDLRSPLPDIHSPDFQKWADIAASAQSVFETCLRKLILHACKITQRQKVLISGGTALNCVAVSKMQNIDGVEVFVPPSPGDAGASIGAAVFAINVLGLNYQPSDDIFPGSSGNEDLKNHPSNIGLMQKIAEPDVMLDVTAELISQGHIIATRIGNMEMGPRALGHRSILCDASNSEIVKKLNEHVKKRAPFRPIAPLVHKKWACDFFDLPDKGQDHFKWMGAVAQAKKATQETYSSICHIDNSARLQIMDNQSPLISELLLACAERNIFIVTNTSFNIAGDPVVFDEIDAFVSMKRMGITYLLQDKGLFEVTS